MSSGCSALTLGGGGGGATHGSLLPVRAALEPWLNSPDSGLNLKMVMNSSITWREKCLSQSNSWSV